MFTLIVAVGVIASMLGVALGSFGSAADLRVTPDDEDDQPARVTVWSPPTRDARPFWETEQLVDEWASFLRRMHRRTARQETRGRGVNLERVLADLRAMS